MSVFILGSYAKALVMTTDRIPLAGETLIGYDFRQTWGGKGSDMAVQAVRLGAEVAYAGVVGDDTFGHEFVGLMQEEGVNIDALTISGELPTGAGLIVKDKEARNVIVVDMGANKLFTPALVDSALSQLKQSNVVLAQLEIPLETALYGLQRAKEFGKITILNPAPARDLRGLDLSAIDYLTPNETEARVALGLPPDDPRSNREIANLLLETGCQYVVMTLGESGSAVFGRNDTQEIPPASLMSSTVTVQVTALTRHWPSRWMKGCRLAKLCCLLTPRRRCAVWIGKRFRPIATAKMSMLLCDL